MAMLYTNQLLSQLGFTSTVYTINNVGSSLKSFKKANNKCFNIL